MRLLRMAAAALAVAVVALAALASPAAAHPLGNFTTNVATRLVVQADRIQVDHVVDLAEIPTFRAMPDIDADGDGTVADTEAARYAADACASQAPDLRLQLDGTDVPLTAGASRLTLVDGQAGLQTARIECGLSTHALDGLGDIAFEDRTFPGRLGWREVVVVGDGATINASDVPDTSPSALLTDYPDEGLQAPLDVREATATATPGGEALRGADPAAVTGVPGVDWATETFTGLVDEGAITVPFAAFAIAVAMVLGGLHAVAPGHGKTVMAAYIVGNHGTMRQALGLGATVAVTHTAGVLVLGITLSTTATFAPERLYPWLGVASGALIAVLGGVLLVRAIRNRGRSPFEHHHHGRWGHHHHDHDHDHDRGHDHAHHHEHAPSSTATEPQLVLAGAASGSASVALPPPAHLGHGHHHHDQGHDHHHHGDDHGHAHAHDDDHHHDDDHDHGHGRERPPGLGRGGVILMGVAGGMVPSPSALVVLLGAIAIGRAWFGVVVIAAYGVGMSVTLLSAGLLMARLRDRIVGWLDGSRPVLGRAVRLLPMATALLVLAGGSLVIARAAQGF